MESDVPTDDSDQQRSYSPLVRRLAEEFEVDLDAIRGTGPGGRVTRADVQQAAFGPNLDHDSSSAGGDPETGEATAAEEDAPDGGDATGNETPETGEVAAEVGNADPETEPASDAEAPSEGGGVTTAGPESSTEVESEGEPEDDAESTASTDRDDTTDSADDTVIETEPAAEAEEPIEIKLGLDIDEVELIVTEPITFSLQAEITADALLRVQDRLRRYREQPIPLAALVVRLLAPSLQEAPTLNTSVADHYEPADSITVSVHLIADERMVELERVESSTLTELAEGVAFGTTESETAPTFAVSCFAGTAVTAAVPTLEDTAAAMTIGQPRDGFRLVNGVAQPTTTITLGLTCAEHIDEVVAARFLSDVSAGLEEPILVFAD